MQTNSNLSCIPFYESLEEQDFRRWYAYGDKYMNRVPGDCLVPFFFPLPATTSAYPWEVTDAKLYRLCCEEEEWTTAGAFSGAFSKAFTISAASVMGTLVLDGLTVVSSGLNPACIYLADPAVGLDLPRGLYYLHLQFSNGKRTYGAYSDVFLAEPRADLSRCAKIEWYCMENQAFEGGFIPYETSRDGVYFKNVLYLDTEIGMPEYTFTEEGEERNGYFFPTKQISEKVFNMKFVAPEYLCDVMRLIRMSDVVKITDNLGRTYRAEQFEMEAEWLEQGHYAEVSCAFQTDTVVKKTGKAYTNITDR